MNLKSRTIGRRLRYALAVTLEGSRELILARGAQNVLLYTARSTEIAGMDVRIRVPEHQHAALVERVRETLGLLGVHRPDVYRGLKRAFRHILVRPGGRPFYFAATRTCLLAASLFDDRYPAYVAASSIVHEYVHGRTHRFFWGMTDVVRTRIEHRCMTEQIDFVRRCPGSEWYEDYLVAYREKTRYDTESHLESQLQMMRDLGTPNWAVRLSALLRKPRKMWRGGS